MQVILKTRSGYLNTDKGVKICEKKNATIFSISDVSQKIREIYNANPMIGKINTEIVEK